METKYTDSQALGADVKKLSEAMQTLLKCDETGARRSVDTAKVETAIEMLLDAIGEDSEREGLKETAQRVARFYRDFIEYDAGSIETSFETEAYGQLITIAGIKVSSLCEHHLLPFSCNVAIAYYPAQRILGLSKFARIAQAAARRLCTQERLTRIIRDAVIAATGAHSVLVLTSESEHSCMAMRGIEEHCAKTSIVDAFGVFYGDNSEREAALRIIRTAHSE